MYLRRGLQLVAGWTVVFFVLLGALQVAAAGLLLGNFAQAAWDLLRFAALPGFLAGVVFAPVFLSLGLRIDSPRLRTAMAVLLGTVAGVIGWWVLIIMSDGWSSPELVSGLALWLGGVPGTTAGLLSGLAANRWSRPTATPRDPATLPVE